MQNRIVIIGAAGRDFHNFNVCYREDSWSHVVAFTATQIPDIAGRSYPAELAGPRYPEGIPIVPEEELERIIQEEQANVAVFSYSDVSHVQVMNLASRALAAGADFQLLSAERTMLKAKVPVVSMCATRTGCGKSPVSRRVAELLKEQGLKSVAIRHPMPYGNWRKQRVQRFAKLADLDRREVHDRRERRIRAARAERHGGVRGSGLRGDCDGSGEGSGRDHLGRRKQRHAVCVSGPGDRGDGSAPRGARSAVPPGRSEPAARERGGDQQGGFGVSRCG